MKSENDKELAVPERASAGKRKKKSKRRKSKTGKKKCPLSCSRRKKEVGESTSRKHKGKKEGKITTSDKSSTKRKIRKVKQAMKRGYASERKRKSRSKSKSRKKRRSKSKSRSRSRSKSKSRSTSKSRSRSASKKKEKGTSTTKERNLLENRQYLSKSQSLSASQPVSEKSLAKPASVTDSSRANIEPSIKPTPQSPIGKRTTQKTSHLAVDANPEFQPLGQTEGKTAKKKDGAPPSTAIDIDSSMRQRRRKKPVESPMKTARSAKDSERHQRVSKYSGELVKGKDNRYQKAKTKQEITFEPSIGASDIQPCEEIDSNYPAQRIVISNFVRKSRLMKRWLYEDSYPINGARPTMKDLICNKGDKCAVKECCCSRRSVCNRLCRKALKNKRTSMDGSVENERIRGELQRLDIILKNLDD